MNFSQIGSTNLLSGIETGRSMKGLNPKKNPLESIKDAGYQEGEGSLGGFIQPHPPRHVNLESLTAMTKEFSSCSMKDLMELMVVLFAKSNETKAAMNYSQITANVQMASSTRSQGDDIRKAANRQLIGALIGAGVQLGGSAFALRSAYTSQQKANTALNTRNTEIKAADTKVATKTVEANYKFSMQEASHDLQTSQAWGQLANTVSGTTQGGFGVWVASAQADQKGHEAEVQSIMAEKEMSQSAAQDLDKSLASFIGLMAASASLQSSLAQGFRV